MPRYKPRIHRTDASQQDIVKALRQVGAYVDTRGPLDLLVGHNGRWLVVEVKDGAKSPSQRKLTRDEIDFILNVQNKAPIHVVQSVEDALNLLEKIHER